LIDQVSAISRCNGRKFPKVILSGALLFLIAIKFHQVSRSVRDVLF